MSPRTRAELLATLVYAAVFAVVVFGVELITGATFGLAIFFAIVGAVVSGVIWFGLFWWRRRSS